MAYHGRNNVTPDVVWFVYNNCRIATVQELKLGVEYELGLEFAYTTIEKILKGDYDEKLIGYPLDWPMSSNSSNRSRFNSRMPSRPVSRSSQFDDDEDFFQSRSRASKPSLLSKEYLPILIIAAIVIYIFRDKISTLLTSLLPIVIMLVVLAVIVLVAKNMLTGRSTFSGKSAGRGRKSSDVNFSFPGICILIGGVLIGLKLISNGDYLSGLVMIGLGVFIANVSKR